MSRRRRKKVKRTPAPRLVLDLLPAPQILIDENLFRGGTPTFQRAHGEVPARSIESRRLLIFLRVASMASGGEQAVGGLFVDFEPSRTASRDCPESRPNSLKFNKETTPDLVRWPRVPGKAPQHLKTPPSRPQLRIIFGEATS